MNIQKRPTIWIFIIDIDVLEVYEVNQTDIII
jgi:hypothetical protein